MAATPTPSTNTPQKHLPAFSSPAPRSVPATMNFDSPAALGLLAEGGVGMGISMSGMGISSLGLTASAMGRADEEERRRRLEGIIGTLKAKPGRVSPRGILELCRREGLEVEQEKAALVLMIGTEGMCEIPVRNGEIVADGVTLELTHDRHDYAATASRVLGDSLKPIPGLPEVNLTLERFSQNLEKLLRMDKLSSPQNGGVSCYQAIFGVYASLKKLFDHEKKMALALLDANDPKASHKAEREVLCKRSGRPRLNAGKCLGLSLEYWMDRRHLFKDKAPFKPDKMEVDRPATSSPEDQDPDTHKIYSLTIECESSPSSMYPPIRISDAWISDAIEKSHSETSPDINTLLLNHPTLDWLEPPPTYLPSSTSGSGGADASGQDPMALDSTPGHLPNIRFVAKFNPPLVVPLSVFVSLQQQLNLDVPTDIRATTFTGLALRPGEADPGMTGTGTSSVTTSESSVLVVDRETGKEQMRTHHNALNVPRTEYSRMIEQLPFSHPRQLVDILPTLRQYAFVTSLMVGTFGPKNDEGEHPEGKYGEEGPDTTMLSPPLTPRKDKQGQEDGKEQEKEALQLDITLSYAPPAPHLRFDMPYPGREKKDVADVAADVAAVQANSPPPPSDLLSSLLNEAPDDDKQPSSNGGATNTKHASGDANADLTVMLDVLPNAELSVGAQNIYPISSSLNHSHHHAGLDDSSKGKKEDEEDDVDMLAKASEAEEKAKRIARALDVCMDVGVWAEWVRGEVERRARGTV